MSTEALKHHDDLGFRMRKIAKFEVAEEQLFDCLNLFVEGRYYSASTLAGAAEEIFSKLLNSRGEQSQLDEAHEFESMIRTSVGQNVRSKSSTGGVLYKLRNSLKHIDIKSRDDFVVRFRLNPDVEAQMLRAVFSYERLKKGRSMPRHIGEAIFRFRKELRKNK
ncbi:MAG: hypothetical protein ABNH30_14835 [Thalassolituus sp.]